VHHDRAVSIKKLDAVSINLSKSRNVVMASDIAKALMLTLLTSLTLALPTAHLVAGPLMFRVPLIQAARIGFLSKSYWRSWEHYPQELQAYFKVELHRVVPLALQIQSVKKSANF
jgi:hypothetical protein